jgi:hypothetical protein
VDEVWYWRTGVIEIDVLTGTAFTRVERSGVLPDLDLELLTSMLDRETLTDAVLEFRKALAGR